MDRLESLYGALSAKYDLGSFDEFKTKLQDPEKRKALYEFASNDFELGDFDSFSLKIEDSFKKKEDGESLSQEDTSDFDFGFYNKAQNAAYKDYIKETANKYQEVFKKDPTVLAILDNVDSEIVRTRNRILDSYIYDPNFNPQDPESIARVNEDINNRLQQKYNDILKNNEEFQSLKAKYDEEFGEDIQKELEARLTEEGRSIADTAKELAFGSGAASLNPMTSIFASLSKGTGYIPIIGDAISFQIPQAFEGWGLKNDSIELNTYLDGIETAKGLEPDAPVYVNERGKLINPAEYGGQMKKDLQEGTLPEESPNGKLMTASEAIALLSDKSEVKSLEMQPKWEDAIEMQEFISRINQVKPLSEDASFSNIMKTLVQQVPNMGVAMVMPVVGTAILEGGNTYLEQVQEIARERVGEDFTIDDLMDVVESGEDGAAEVTGAAYVSGLLDLVGLGGVGTFISKSAKAVGKQILKEGLKQGIKKVSKTQLANIGKSIAGSGLSEGITEGLQGANMQFSRINTVERATGQRPDFNFQAVLEEGLIGFLMGGIMGGAGGVTTALTTRSKESLPQSISEVTETEDKAYFDGSEAISRNQADQRIKRAKTIKELEKIRVANDEPLIAKFLERKAELEKAEQVAPAEETKKTFNPKGFYEAIDEQGNPIVSFTDQETGMTEFESSETPQLSASKTIGGAITGLFSMRRSTGQKPSGAISIYRIDSKPDVEINPVNIADFAFIDEVRYNSKVEGTEIAKIELDENTIDFLTDFYNSFEATEEEYNALLSKYNANDRAELEGIFKDRIKSIYPSRDTGYFRAEFTSTEETAQEVAPEVLNLLTEKQREAYNKADEETKEAIREVLLDESYERSIGVSDEPTPEWVSEEEQIEWEGEEELYRSGADFSTVIDNLLGVTPKANEQVFVFGLAEYDIDKADSIIKNQDVELIDIPKNALPKLSYGFVLKTEEGIENADITNPVILARTDKGLLLIDGHHRVERALRDGKTVKAYVLTQEQARSTRLDLEDEAVPEVAPEVLTAEDKPVEEAKPVKTPEMEELENEIATLQSDIETYEIEAENTQEEIDIEKGNLKDALADIDARIKEVRASKQSAAAKRDAIEELKAEKQDVKDDNASLIEGYKEEIKNAKREAKKAANRIKRLSTKLEGLAPVQPVAEEKTYTMKDVSFEDDIKAIIKSGKPGKEVLNYTDTYKDDGQDYYVYKNPESRLDVTIRKTAPQSFAVDMTVMSSDTFSTPYATYESGPVFGTRKRAEQAALEILRNPTLLYSGLGAVRTSLEPDLAKALIESRGIEPTKKVVGTLEVEEDVEPSITESLVSTTKSLRGQVDAGVITKKEYNQRIAEELNKYTERLDAVIDDNPPVDVISADDTAADIRAFEAQSPKLKFVSQLLSATKNFRGLYDVQDISLRVYFYKSMDDMNEVGKAIDGREDIAAGFIDADTNRIFIAEDALMEEAAIHEFIHPIAKRIIINNPKLATRIEQEALAIPGIKEFVEQYETKDQQEEAIVQSIALAVLDNLKKGRTIPQKIKDFFMKLLRLLGFNPEVVIGDSQSNLNDFIRNISEAFATGRPIKITEDLEQQGILFDINTKPAPTEEIKITESQVGQPVSKIKFSDRKELKGVKFINPKQFNGKKVVVTAYDNLKTGVVRWKNRKTGKSFTFDKKQGGPAHGFLAENKRNNVVAAFTKLNVVLKFAKAAKDAEFLLYSLMSTESSLKANRSIFQDLFGQPLEDIANEFGFENFKSDLKTVLTTKGVEKFKSDLDNIATPAELAAYVDNLTFPKRRAIFTNMFPEVKGTPTKSTIMQDKYGLPTAGEIYVMYQEEGMNNATDGDIFAASKIRPVILVNEKEYAKISKKKIGMIGEAFGIQVKQIAKESEHPAYPFAIEGEMVGMFSNLVNARDVLSYVPKDAKSAYKYIEGNGPKETTTEIDENAEVRVFDTEGTQEAVVTAAPIRVFPEFFARKFKGKTPTVKDIVAIKNSPMFKSYRKKFIDSAQLFNITVGNITTNIGIWEGALEYSNNLEVKGAPADLKAFAAYMGLVAEPQEATIVSKAREGAESAAINIEYRNEALAQKAVDDIREEGIIGLSYDTDRKIITIFAQEGDQERFQSYHEKHKSSIKNVEFYEADVDFISEADYEGILREYRSSEQNQGARRQDLRDAITEVLGESPDSPSLPGTSVSRIKHTKSTRQNIIRPAEAIQEEFKKRLTPRRVGSTYYGKLGILTTVDINELGGLVNPNTGATIGLDLVKEYNKVMPELVKQVMPLPKQLEPALQLADKIREALDFTTHDKIVEYARILLASIDNPTEFESDQKAIDAIRNAFVEFDVQEFTETDLEFVTENISEIRGYASEVYLSGLKNTKFSDRMKGTKYEGKEALIKNDIVRSGTEILLQQRDELAAAGYKKISVEQLDLTDTHMEAIAEKLGGGEDFVKILKSNRKSITNMARNDLRNKNVVSGLVESSKRYFQRGVPRKYVQGDIYASEKVLDKILAIIKPKFSDTEIKVLEDYMEYSEVRRLFQTIQSLQHGYLPPMAYGIIRKFEAAVNAIELAGKVGNMSIMVDANGRLIKERVAVREARKLTTASEELTKSDMDALQKRTTTGAMPLFKRQVDKVIPILYNQISKAFSVIESQREIDIAKYNEKFAKVKPIARFEGTQYTNSDVNMLGHMYLIEKQYLSNPGSNKVPKLYESLILSITDESVNAEENLRYKQLFEDFKLENNTLDIQKVERFLKFMGAMTGATKESGMGIVDFVSKRMRDSRDRVKHLQEFQNKTQVEVFDNYIYVATKPNANTGEVKATMIESLLNKDASNTLGFAKTSITRQTYRNTDGTLRKIRDNREPVFDLMFAANYATNEVLSAYHLGEEFRNIQAQLNILAKLGDTETQILASALKNDIRQRIINTFEYKMDRPTGTAEKFIQKMLSGTYTTYLASARRFVELFSNAALVSIASPTVAKAMVVNYKENIGNATMDETKSIMDKIGSAHRERFNKTGKAFYSAEGIGAERITGAKQTPSIWDNVKKKKSGEFREAYVAFKNAMNRLGEIQTGIKNFGDKIVRMSDTKIGAVAWNAIFKERFQEITGIEYSSAMLTDADLFIQNRLAMKEAGNYADVFLKESFAGGAFDMNQKALKNKGTMKYLQNMFRTFRTFYYESNRNAIRSLIGLQDGTMTKEEAARRLAGASGASIIYAIGTTHLMSLLWQQLFLATGLADEEEEREWTTAAKQAVAEFLLLSSIGRAPAIGYGLVSGAVRGTIRYMDQDDLTALEAFNKFAQRLSGSNFLLRQTVPIIGEPAMLAKKTIESALDAAQGELEGEDAQELFLEILKTAVIYQGIPFSGDIMSGLYTLQRMNEEEKKPKKRKKPKFKSVLD